MTLLEQLQSATEGSWELDAAIALALGKPQAYFNSFDKDTDGNPHEGFAVVDGPDCFDEPTWGGGGRTWTAECYTTNLQDAVSLEVPGYIFRGVVSNSYATDSVYQVIPESVTAWSAYYLPIDRHRPPGEIIGQHDDMKLAVCIAIIKAHQSKGPKLTDRQKQVIDDLV